MAGRFAGTRWCGAVVAAVVGAALLLARGVAAQEPGQAGLAVQFEDGRVETRCVALTGERTTGADLLAQSGLDVVIDAAGGMGATVCRIEGEGCDFPGQDCFCRCSGAGECRYWNYFYRDAGAETWTYSPLGAQLRQVRAGAVDAWVWGDGHTPPAADLAFAAICAAPTAPPSPTAAAPSASPAAAASPAPAVTGSTAVALASPVLSVTEPSPPPAGRPAGGAGYWLFGAMAVVLLAAGLFVRLRRRHV